MKPIFYQGDCLKVLPTLASDSLDSIVTDPPYGISFLSKDWDHGVPGVVFWKEALRVAKPGAFILAFGGTRTFHRLACAIEDAGWELKDTIMWVYGSGFPKSLDVAKAIDKSLGAKPTVIGKAAEFARDGSSRKTDGSHVKPHCEQGGHGYGDRWSAPVTKATTEEAKKWSGWGTSLKPAWEPIIVARKPLDGTVAQNILKHGVGAMNIDECRVEYEANSRLLKGGSYGGNRSGAAGDSIFGTGGKEISYDGNLPPGRWPANLIHDGSDEVLENFAKAGDRPSCNSPSDASCESKYRPGQGEYQKQGPIYPGDNGSAARFFYCAKASQADRDEGLEDAELKVSDPYAQHRGRRMPNGSNRIDGKPAKMGKNNHPTVKPTALMRYLCRLVTPEGGVVLDPFMGSGSTGKAAMLEGFGFVGIEKEAEYAEIAKKRVREDPFS